MALVAVEEFIQTCADLRVTHMHLQSNAWVLHAAGNLVHQVSILQVHVVASPSRKDPALRENEREASSQAEDWPRSASTDFSAEARPKAGEMPEAGTSLSGSGIASCEVLCEGHMSIT